jgi:hypothetical protein
MDVDTGRLIELPPGEAARLLVRQADDEWLSELQRTLDRERAQLDLDRILAVWGLSQTDAAELFHVSRQAIGKWRTQGLPAGRIEAVSDLAAATDLLLRHLKRDRIPAVVRRRAARLGGESLLDLVAAGRTREMLDACRRMFRFGDAHA